jgi:hypothetical protein
MVGGSARWRVGARSWVKLPPSPAILAVALES